MSFIKNCNSIENEYSDTCSLFNTENKENDDFSISSEKSLKNRDLNMSIDNNFKDIMITNTKKNTKEINPKMKLKNHLIFKINKMPYLEKDINNIVKIMNINEEAKNFLSLNVYENNEEIKNLRFICFLKKI